MVLTHSCMFLAGALLSASSGPVALDNGKIRIELEPRTFSVQFIGVPGGDNFLEPIHLTATELDGAGWLEPGGLTTDVLPARREDAVLRRGPAEVVEQRDDYVLLLGPEQPELHWRVKKEVQLARDTPELTYKVTVLSSLKGERDVRIRNMARMAWRGSLKVPAAAGPVGLLRGAFPGFDDLLKESDTTFTIPLLPPADRVRAVLTSPSAEVMHETPSGSWTRRIEIYSALPEEGATNQIRMMALLDDASHSYQSALEGGQSGVNVGAPLVVIEHWSLNATAYPGTKGGEAPGVHEEERHP